MRIFRAIFFVCSIAAAAADSTFAGSIVTNAPRPVQYQVQVQPVILANTNGSNPSVFFGTDPHRLVIESMVDQIWSQAGIDIKWLAPVVWKHAAFNMNINENQFALDVASDAATAGKTNPTGAPHVINAFFTHKINGVNPGSNWAKGTAIFNDPNSNFVYNGTFQVLGSGTVSNPGKYDRAARLVSHELGHNLGLPGLTSNTNLMLSYADENADERLTPAQIAIVQQSSFVIDYTPPGDFNGDDAIDGADLQIWENSYGGTTTNGNTDDDNDVDGTDYLTIQRNFQPAPLTAIVQTIPEPSSLVLATAFLFLLNGRNRR